MGIAQQAADAFFMMCAALASPLFFIMHSPVIYHEASLVSVACAIWTFVLLLRYRERGRLGLLIGAFFCALASFQARGSVGVGPMLSVALVSGALAVSILDRRYTWLQGTVTRHLPPVADRVLRRHAAVIALIAGICTSAVAYKNVVVFGSLTGTPPISRHIQLINAPRRLAATDGGNFVQPLISRDEAGQ
jgi:hypothetical protein